MSLLFDQIQSDIPQIHVFMVGVGGYPYLTGGSKCVKQKIDVAQQLGQLTSPPVSVEAFYNTIMDLQSRGSWIKPLGSIEVLLSKAPAGKDVFTNTLVEIESATRKNIEDAYFRWKGRCKSNEDNVAIFFFCGHGLDKAEHYLLAEDFGEEPENPWRGCFAFDRTRRAFFSCKASTQLFFVDSCRQITPDMLNSDLQLSSLDNPDFTSKDCKFDLTQKAAAANESAYSKKNEVSFYTKALIEALNGKAATNYNGWEVRTGTLSTKMNSLIALEAPSENYIQRCISNISDETAIIKFASPPQIPIEVTCSPRDALLFAKLSCADPNTDYVIKRDIPEPNFWSVKLNAGIYKFQADFPGKEYIDKFNFRNIGPLYPSHPEELQTQKLINYGDKLSEPS